MCRVSRSGPGRERDCRQREKVGPADPPEGHDVIGSVVGPVLVQVQRPGHTDGREPRGQQRRREPAAGFGCPHDNQCNDDEPKIDSRDDGQQDARDAHPCPPRPAPDCPTPRTTTRQRESRRAAGRRRTGSHRDWEPEPLRPKRIAATPRSPAQLRRNSKSGRCLPARRSTTGHYRLSSRPTR